MSTVNLYNSRHNSPSSQLASQAVLSNPDVSQWFITVLVGSHLQFSAPASQALPTRGQTVRRRGVESGYFASNSVYVTIGKHTSKVYISIMTT